MEQFEKVCKALGKGFGNGVGNAISFQYPGTEKKYNVTTLLGDALSLIRQQQERIKELEAWKKWISVKDRVPDEMTCEYLVVNNGAVGLAIYHDGLWISPSRSVNITHWMQLPEPPKEGEHAYGA